MKDQTHEQVQPLLAIYRDLNPEQQRRVQAHLEQCPECAQELAEFQAMDRQLGELGERQQRRFRQRQPDTAGLLAQIEADERPTARLRRFLGPPARLATGVIGILFLIAVAGLFTAWFDAMSEGGVEGVSAPAPTRERTEESDSTRTEQLATERTNSIPTPLPDNLSLTASGWIHYIEQVANASMTTIDPESGEVVNLETDYQLEVWALLDEQGRVVSRVSHVRDLDGNMLQMTTLRDGVLRNLTFQEEMPFEGQPAPFHWADPDSPIHRDPKIQLLMIERADTPPAEVLALLEQEIESNACAGLELIDKEAWDVRARYNSWVDALAGEIGGQPDRWLHVLLDRQQNPAAIIHEDSPLPLDYRSEQWIQLDERGRVVARVAVMADREGEPFSTGVVRDGISYTFERGETYPYTPQRLILDGSFFGNSNTSPGAGGGLARAEELVGGQPALLFSFCQSYNGARPRFGDLPYPIEGDQWHLWLDAESGQPLRSGHGYADTTGRVRVDWIEDISVEMVDGLPPEAEALWQQAEADLNSLAPTPSPPAVPYSYPGISFTLQGVSYDAYQTTVSLTVQIATDNEAEAQGASWGQVVLFDDVGNQYQPTIGNASSENAPPGLVAEVSQTFEPGLTPDAKRLTLQTGLSLHWSASQPITLDLRGRQPGDRWPVGQTVEIYGLQVPIEEAALVADSDAPPDSLTIQLFAPCVNQDGVELTYFWLQLDGGQHMGDGPDSSGCGSGEEQVVSSLTVRALQDGSPPIALETAVLRLGGWLELPGPWELSWEVER